MKRVKLLFIVQCLLLVCLSQHSVAQVSVKAEIDSVQILIGSQAQLSIEVVAPEQSLVQMPAYQPRSYLTKGVEIVEVFPLDTIQQSDRTITLQQRLSITAFDEHLYPIPAQHIRVNNKDYKTNALALKVVTLDVDTLHPEKFFPPKPLQRNPWWWSDLLPACCCWLVALIFALAWAYANRLYNSRLSFLKQWLRRKPLPPHVVALKALGDIRNMSLSAPLFYSQITEILRRYLAARFHVNAMEMTTREILRAVQQTDELLFCASCSNGPIWPSLRSRTLPSQSSRCTSIMWLIWWKRPNLLRSRRRTAGNKNRKQRPSADSCRHSCCSSLPVL